MENLHILFPTGISCNVIALSRTFYNEFQGILNINCPPISLRQQQHAVETRTQETPKCIYVMLMDKSLYSFEYYPCFSSVKLSGS